MNNRTTWKSSFSITPPKGLPAGVREAARQLEIHIPDEFFWREGEGKAAKILLESAAMVSIWRHLSGFIEPHWWYMLLVDVFIEPFGWLEKPFHEEEEAQRNALHYARVAAYAFELMELLDTCPMEGRPGHLFEVDELIERSDLKKDLLRLVSLTTACEWPKVEYAEQYGPPEKRPSSFVWGDCRNAERFTLWRPSKAKDRQNCIGAEYNGFEFYSYIYKRNPRYYDRFKESPPYDYSTGEDREIFLKKDDPIPPLFEPVHFPEYSTATIKANTKHMGYLKQVIKELDSFSSDTLGRPPRARGGEKSNGRGRNSPLWLDIEHYEVLLGVLFPGIDISASQIRRELNKGTPSSAKT
ncbi:MAG: hypothetical protein M0Q49_06140 [Porticoccaceae bacterium]|nr:hypothetical protein [Porticoccaceae bacterium]